MPVTLKELADFCGARIEGGDVSAVIHSAADIMSAQTGQVTQLTSARYAPHIKGSTASACIVAEGFKVENVPDTMALLVCADPEISFIKAVQLLHPGAVYTRTIAPLAVIADNVLMGGNLHVGPYAVISEGASIGDGSEILAGVYIGSNVKIGRNCRIYPYAVIYDGVVVGDNVIIHSGAIIGADGFGYKFRNNEHVKVPQVGNVVIG
ncbi:MAG: LpxD N-terminal domain-containing protein, partial [Gammaproteobacteria bacterium]